MKKPHFGLTRTGHEVHLSTADYHKSGSGYERFNKWCAVWVTRNVGTMTAFWIFTVLAMLVAPSCLFVAGYIHWHVFFATFGFNLLATLILSTWLELALMPAIMVGQNLQNAASDARAAKQFEDTEYVKRMVQDLYREQTGKDAPAEDAYDATGTAGITTLQGEESSCPTP